MRILVVYFSKFGNTRKLAEAMAETMNQAGQARAIAIDQLSANDFEGVDLVVMGTPTHALSVPQEVRTVLDTLPLSVLSGKSVAAFDTTVRWWPLRRFRASPKLLARLTRLGGRRIARPETFRVRTKGEENAPEPNLLFEGELDHARKWAAKLLEQSRA
jgi:flavodoxin